MSNKQSPKNKFTAQLMNWHYHANNRQMPWKGERDPYKIWLSEIILQQTRVNQGLPYFKKFVHFYPSVSELAAAPDEAVFKLWEGLGYYSRCRNLLACARQVVTEHSGEFPANHHKLLTLKGIGPYTAAAIASFAFDLPHAVVDGNVTRVLSRYFGIRTAIDSPAGKKIFSLLANELLDTNAPAAFNQAIMDFGAVVCTPADPKCNSCQLQDCCLAFSQNIVGELPYKAKKLARKTRYFTFFIISADNKKMVRERFGKDIWQNLYEYFQVESENAHEWELVSANNSLGFTDSKISEVTIKGPVLKQQLTHQTVYARFIEVTCSGIFDAPATYEWKTGAEINNLAFPRIINTYQNDSSGASVALF